MTPTLRLLTSRHPIKLNRGFTIVELLIVIVVIAILAAIAVVAFNGVQVKAQNSSRTSDLQNWKRIFLSYKAVNGTWPTMTTQQDYCLGTGFPVGYNNEQRCRDYQYQTGSGLYSYKESDSAGLMSQLNTVGRGPNPKDIVKSEGPYYGAVGPYAQVDTDGTLVITGIFKGVSGQCPPGLTEQYADNANKMVWCQIRTS